MNRFTQKLQSLPPAGKGQGYHAAILGAANSGIIERYSPADIVSAIRNHTQTAGRNVPDREIQQAVEKAARDIKQPGTFQKWTPRQPAKRFDPLSFMGRLQRDADGISEVEIWESSFTRIDWSPKQDAVELLTRLFRPEEYLFIGDQYGTEVKTVSEWLDDFRKGKPIPPHIIPNPMTGEKGITKDGKESFRADSCVKSFRFAVVEFDNLTRDEQLRFWWSIALPVIALIDSGGKSIHGWVKIDGIENAEQWTEQVENKLFTQYLIPLGCDGACKNEARLSRMPGHFRTEKGRWQRILWLCPEGRRVNPCEH